MTTPPHAPAPSPSEGITRIVIDLAGCTDKACLLARIAAAMKFPAWFGHNWDALADCLADLSWLPAGGYSITVSGSLALRAAEPDTLATALDILDEAATFWVGEGVVFRVEVREDGGADSASPPLPPAAPR